MRILSSRLFRLPVNARRNCIAVRTSSGLTHTPVLLREVLSSFRDSDLRVFLDCTMGGGGHTTEIIRNHPELECVVGVDMDLIALKQAQRVLDPIIKQRAKLQMYLLQGNFSDLAELMMDNDPPVGHLLNEGIDGILMDLGMSSIQLDEANRGFSFMKDGPLDMRMGNNIQTSAEEIINTWSEFELGTLFRSYGEEFRWRQIARRICEARENEIIKTTRQLVEIIGKGNQRHQHKKSIHPATRVFQALRIAVNDELRSLEKSLPLMIESLKHGGIFSVISFHSLEDRIVKNTFKAASQSQQSKDHDYEHYTHLPSTYTPEILDEAKGRVLTKRPIIATEEETEANPRSRSAKLRIFQKSVHSKNTF